VVITATPTSTEGSSVHWIVGSTLGPEKKLTMASGSGGNGTSGILTRRAEGRGQQRSTNAGPGNNLRFT
jgi:hypothetical protein